MLDCGVFFKIFFPFFWICFYFMCFGSLPACISGVDSYGLTYGCWELKPSPLKDPVSGLNLSPISLALLGSKFFNINFLRAIQGNRSEISERAAAN